MRPSHVGAATLLAMLLAACSDSPTTPLPTSKNPATAPKAVVDRFSAAAGHLFVRTAGNGLPAAGAPINMDVSPFVTQGLGPGAERIRYYNFDVQSRAPAPIFVLYREGEADPVTGQLNIVDVIPGSAGYSDFWRVMKVTVPSDYVANTITSVAEIRDRQLRVEATPTIVNCPIVPEGSTAQLHLGPAAGLTRGWYRGMTVAYFTFDEAPLSVAAGGQAPVAPIYVTFTVNAGEVGGGPASGFRTEGDSPQTHNVAAALPSQPGYSPLWTVHVYDNADFARVADLTTAVAAKELAVGDDVNCPIVAILP